MRRLSTTGVLSSFFFGINALIFLLYSILEKGGFDMRMLLIGHVIVFLMTLVSSLLLTGSLKAASTAAFLRGVYGSFLFKFFLVAITTLAYAFVKRQEVNKPGLFTLMALYLIYTFLEIRGLLIQQKKKEHV
jgi:hypothetical protein